MILLRAELFEGLDQIKKLREVLQTALELEHATIPPYLAAAFSLAGANATIRSLVLDVAREEMLHMTLVCNVLNAIGGQPRLKGADFLPRYPTHLPGAVQDQLIVPIESFSLRLLETVLMQIEQPEDPKDFPVAAAVGGPRTIGQFYAQIKAVLQTNKSAFTGDPDRQVLVTIDDDDSFAVTDVESAVRAIDLIVGQGEGTPTSPLEGPNGEPAHYYRFAEILKGRELKEDPSVPEGFSYSGEPIPFDPKGVLAIKPNVKLADLPIDSQAHQLAEQFNRDYGTMLTELHRTFNGEPDRLDLATNLMRYNLKTTARQLMQIEIAPGVHAAPTFEVTPA
jgi:ferritin-like protein